MNFASDNTAGVAPEVMAALARANEGSAPAYGADTWSRGLERRLSAFFDHPVRIFPVATGTAANALALAALTPPFGAILAHPEAHIAADEAGAPEFFTGGAKLELIDGADAKIAAADFERYLDTRVGRFPHAVKLAALSLSQATESGTVYTPAEVAALADCAHAHGMRVHMDGARLANALAHLGASPADLTWRAGVDVLSLGFTKNGALAADAVVFFADDRAEEFAYRRKRGGHLFSKMRFAAVQFEAMLEGDLWLKLARHANAMATRLARDLGAVPGVRILHPVEANEVFAAMPEPIATALEAAGAGGHRWTRGSPVVMRFVASFATPLAHVKRAVTVALAAANGKRPRHRRR